MTEKQKPEPLPEWARDAVAAEPVGFMREVVNDAYRGISQTASLIPPRQRSEEKPRQVSGGTVEVKPPPGIDLIDRMCIQQDRLDRAAAVRVRVETEAVERAMAEGTSRRARTEYEPLARYDSEVPSTHREKGE
jgi:hypothetical protein